ncbi:hypothetical protein [Dyadobacter sp. CY312]|uniref:hypothetical protein n=1 Tax=Dyadobacter sp. CY312 TaxID=2907303 RepID=UPI001F2AF5F1|nr:hypothetical protein [Dyadobacter sp. CY312]MCE7038981.1 hypothetical protein [Dyadobacter sp. CY312]
MCKTKQILEAIYQLKPGERAIIEIESLKDACKDGIKAAITCVSTKEKKSKEDYFRIISAVKRPNPNIIHTIED